MSSLTSRMSAVQSPLIPIVGELIRSNPGTISLGQGVVHYSPPPEAIAFLSQFLTEANNHKYQAVVGIPPLISAITAKLQSDNRIEINDNNSIVVTAGSNMGLMRFWRLPIPVMRLFCNLLIILTTKWR